MASTEEIRAALAATDFADNTTSRRWMKAALEAAEKVRAAPSPETQTEFDPDPPTRAYVGLLKSEIEQLRGENAALRKVLSEDGLIAPPAHPHNPAIDEAWIARFAEWNLRTFGPGLRTAGTVDHIRKECREIEANPTDPKEWVDIILLGINGLVRQGRTPAQIIAEIHGKHTVNEARNWPDWRETDPNKAIEHDRSKDVSHD